MAQDRHTVSSPRGTDNFNNSDKILLGCALGQNVPAGGGAGLAVNIDVTGLDLPSSFGVIVNPGQDATWYITNKTNQGFRIVLAPRLAASTIAANALLDWFLFG